VLEDEAILNRFITDIRSVLEIEVLNSLLCDLAKYRPGNYLIQPFKEIRKRIFRYSRRGR